MRPWLFLCVAAAALAGTALATHPYVQSELYVQGASCCTFGVLEDDVSLRGAFMDATSPAGLSPGARVAVHGTNHNPLHGFSFCGAGGVEPVPATTDHFHVYLLGPADQLALCGPASGPGPTAGTIAFHMNS